MEFVQIRIAKLLPTIDAVNAKQIMFTWVSGECVSSETPTAKTSIDSSNVWNANKIIFWAKMVYAW